MHYLMFQGCTMPTSVRDLTKACLQAIGSMTTGYNANINVRQGQLSSDLPCLSDV